jgi:hypothetical protein
MSDGAGLRIGIVVLGMHRTGTSLMGQILGRLGCDPPRTMIGPSIYNARGYWESSRVSDFNDRLLAQAGTTWDDWQDVSEATTNWTSPEAEADAILADEFGQSPLFVLKDPRICRLVPFWLSRLTSAGIRPLIILTLRNPVEVAASLGRRDAIEPQLAHLIWLRHMLAAEAATRGMPRVVTEYDALHADWRGVMKRAGRILGMDWPLDPDHAQDGEVIVTGLRHFQSSTDALTDASLPAGLARCHAILQRWAQEGENPHDHTTLNAILTQFDKDAAVFGPLVALGRKRAVALEAVKKQMAVLDADRSAAQTECDNLREELAQLAQLTRRIEVLRKQVDMTAQKSIDDGATTKQTDVLADLRQMLDMAMSDLRAQSEVNAELVADHRQKILSHTAEAAKLSALLLSAETDVASCHSALIETRAMRDMALRTTSQQADIIRILQVLHQAHLIPNSPDSAGLMEALRSTGLFDPDFYLQSNPDVAESGVDPWQHYLHYGIAEGRPPNPGNLKPQSGHQA